MQSRRLFEQQSSSEPGQPVITQPGQSVDLGGAVISSVEITAAGEASVEQTEEPPVSAVPLAEEPPPPPPPVSPPEDSSNKLNVNTAGPEEIELLPGIGAKTVAKIVRLRNESPFVSNEDLIQRVGSHINWAELGFQF